MATRSLSKVVDPSSGEELLRHPDLWFEDGSVICRAENQLFRVHMSQLSRHSECFRDMFAMPQPSSPSKSSDGNKTITTVLLFNCPVIRLHDDPDDLAVLFTALYDGPNFGNNDQEDFRKVSGLLRLSTKYIIDSLRTKSLEHLSKAWPASLKAWDAREDRVRGRNIENAESGSFRYPSPLAVINLAREVHAPSLLPAAFYDLSRYSFSQIFESSLEDSLCGLPSMADPSLHPIDMQRLCLGKEASAHAITTMIQAMGNSQHVRQPQFFQSHMRRSSGTAANICLSAANCRKDFSELVDLATQHYLFDRERGANDPLYVAEELGQLKSVEFSECKACARSLEAWAAKERQKLWKLIPVWFRLESPSPPAEVQHPPAVQSI